MSSQLRMPTHLWVEAKITELSSQGIGVYVLQKGERHDGTLLLKIANRKGQCKLLTQQRNLDGVLEWIDALYDEILDENRADEFISRSKRRDPDQWIIEIESPDMDNPFK